MLWDSRVSQLSAQLPLGHKAFIAHDGSGRNAGRWQWIWGSEAGRMEFGAFPSSSCFPARRNPVCPSFVLLAVLRFDGLATDAGQIHSKGDKEGRERNSEPQGEERRRDPGKKG